MSSVAHWLYMPNICQIYTHIYVNICQNIYSIYTHICIPTKDQSLQFCWILVMYTTLHHDRCMQAIIWLENQSHSVQIVICYDNPHRCTLTFSLPISFCEQLRMKNQISVITWKQKINDQCIQTWLNEYKHQTKHKKWLQSQGFICVGERSLVNAVLLRV